MPLGSRNAMYAQAKVNRNTGQLVQLLIPQAQAVSTATPLSISQADSSVNLSTAKAVNVYANVTWKSGQFTYGEGGQTLMKVASVEIPADWVSVIVQAYAVRLMDGEVLIKKSQTINESGTTYTLSVESNVATQQ